MKNIRNKAKKLLKRLSASSAGYTLIEIPVVLAIVTGAMLLTAENAVQAIAEARDVRRATDAYQVTTALAFYYDDTGAYPAYTGIDALASWSVLEAAIEPSYIQELPRDPLNDGSQEYRYWSDGQVAKVFFVAEHDGEEKERWIF